MLDSKYCTAFNLLMTFSDTEMNIETRAGGEVVVEVGTDLPVITVEGTGTIITGAEIAA